MSNEELWQLFPIILREHNSAWKQWYEQEHKLLIRLIGEDNIERVSHIGSTAVEGLVAKPTVDILVEITRSCDTDDLMHTLEQNGYIYSRQGENPPPHMMFLKGYTEQGFAEKVFHIHMRYPGDWDELYFRDYLSAHADTAAQYGELKASLKEKYEHDRDMYTEAKTDFVKRVTMLARQEMGNVYNPETGGHNDCCSIGIIGGADGPTAVFIAGKESGSDRQRKWDKTLEVCKSKAVPVERLKSGDEMKTYLMEVLGAQETAPLSGQKKSLKINALMNSHPETLQQPAMPDEAAPKKEWIEWAKKSHMAYSEAAERLPDDAYGFRYTFLRIPRNKATKVYYRARTKENKTDVFKRLFERIMERLKYGKSQDPDITLDIELTTCHMSMGNGCARLMNDLVLWRGITQQDIDECTPQFMAYAAAMRDTGELGYDMLNINK
jgi:GrpB-like predicted nucleotidyltransferase (UPF0157 family)